MGIRGYEGGVRYMLRKMHQWQSDMDVDGNFHYSEFTNRQNIVEPSPYQATALTWTYTLLLYHQHYLCYWFVYIHFVYIYFTAQTAVSFLFFGDISATLWNCYLMMSLTFILPCAAYCSLLQILCPWCCVLHFLQCTNFYPSVGLLTMSPHFAFRLP